MSSPLDDVTLELVRDYDDLTRCLNWLGQRRQGILGIDTETTGLEWWWKHSAMRTLQIGDEKTGWTIPHDFAGAFRTVLPDYTRNNPVAFHHASFDLHFLRIAGFDFSGTHHNIYDTQVMARLADPLKSGALKSASARMIDPMASAGDRLLHKHFRETGYSWDTIPIETDVYWSYAALDPVLTSHLCRILYPKVGHTEVHEVERVNAVTIATEMERLGVYVNMEYVEQRYDVLGTYLEQLQDWIHKQTGGAVDNPNGDQQVRRYLLEQGCHFTKVTPKARDLLGTDRYEEALRAISDPQTNQTLMKVAKRKNQSVSDVECDEQGFPVKYLSIDGDSLEAIGHPVADAIKIHRDQHRVRNTYLQAYLDLTDSDGYLHSSIWTMEAKTGRMSISRPSMQNLPRDQHPRNSIMASPGNLLVLSDYDQVEGRIMAHLAKDPAFINLIREGDALKAEGKEGYDLHSQTARLVFGIPMDQPVPKAKRSIAKNITFAILYGAGISKVAMMSSLPVQEAEMFHGQYLSAIPGVSRFMKAIENEAWRTFKDEGISRISNPMGRDWYVKHPNDSYKLVNYRVQGEAALVLKKALIRLYEHGLSPYVRLPVHDEVICDVPTAEAEEVKRLVPEILRDDSYDVPLTADGETYEVWGTKYIKAA